MYNISPVMIIFSRAFYLIYVPFICNTAEKKLRSQVNCRKRYYMYCYRVAGVLESFMFGPRVMVATGEIIASVMVTSLAHIPYQ